MAEEITEIVIGPDAKARVAHIVLVTVEEQRAIAILDEVRRRRDPGSDLMTRDIAGRFVSRAGNQLPDAAGNVTALDMIKDRRPSCATRRSSSSITGSSLVVTTPARSVPDELRELEQAIIDAMYQAFAEERDIDDEDIIAAIARIVPLSRSQREVIERLCSWLRDGRALAGLAARRRPGQPGRGPGLGPSDPAGERLC
jgi:hypothetical protein